MRSAASAPRNTSQNRAFPHSGSGILPPCKLQIFSRIFFDKKNGEAILVGNYKRTQEAARVALTLDEGP